MKKRNNPILRGISNNREKKTGIKPSIDVNKTK